MGLTLNFKVWEVILSASRCLASSYTQRPALQTSAEFQLLDKLKLNNMCCFQCPKTKKILSPQLIP